MTTSISPSASSSSSSSSSLSPYADAEFQQRLLTAVKSNAKRTRQLYCLEEEKQGFLQSTDVQGTKNTINTRLALIINTQYQPVKHLPPPIPIKQTTIQQVTRKETVLVEDETNKESTRLISDSINSLANQSTTAISSSQSSASSTAVTLYHPPSSSLSSSSSSSTALMPFDLNSRSRALSSLHASAYVSPEWHAPWRLMRVISGHQGWVRCVAVDPGNEWFVTGSNDRTIKIWDLASGELKLTLTGHVSSIRGVAVDQRHPYLFSCSEDKTVKCWDLEQNKVIRNYHGHLSGVYCLSLHPTLDLLFSGGRDATCRVWDMRTKAEVSVLAGHSHTVASVVSQSTEPQVITGSHDSTIKLWDLVAGRPATTLTHHKKSIRALLIHPTEYTFASAAVDQIKVWKCPEGIFMRNFIGHQGILNTMTINRENVLVSGGDDGIISWWDWNSGYRFHHLETIAQPGSLDSEKGIFSLSFDMTGSRLLTAEADKTIKVYKEDEEATQESFPINFKPAKRKRY